MVGVADDGGSSGRLRQEFAIPPPGDLRMALAALCGDDPVGRSWSRVLQHRFAGTGALGGHAVGNLLISALWETTGAWSRGWISSARWSRRAVGLPSTTEPMELVAEVEGLPGLAIGESVVVRGQADVASSGGTVVDIRLEPSDAQVCEEAAEAVMDAEFLVLGPGSWFTSVLPHFEIDGLRSALEQTPAKRILVLNLESHTQETAGYLPETHLVVLRSRYPQMRLDLVLADPARCRMRRGSGRLHATWARSCCWSGWRLRRWPRPCPRRPTARSAGRGVRHRDRPWQDPGMAMTAAVRTR